MHTMITYVIYFAWCTVVYTFSIHVLPVLSLLVLGYPTRRCTQLVVRNMLTLKKHNNSSKTSTNVGNIMDRIATRTHSRKLQLHASQCKHQVDTSSRYIK